MSIAFDIRNVKAQLSTSKARKGPTPALPLLSTRMQLKGCNAIFIQILTIFWNLMSFLLCCCRRAHLSAQSIAMANIIPGFSRVNMFACTVCTAPTEGRHNSSKSPDKTVIKPTRRLQRSQDFSLQDRRADSWHVVPYDLIQCRLLRCGSQKVQNRTITFTRTNNKKNHTITQNFSQTGARENEIL